MLTMYAEKIEEHIMPNVALQTFNPYRYTLEELLACCDTTKEPSEEDRLWLSEVACGSELI